MKIYIAASFASSERIYEMAEALEEKGYIVTGVWFQPHDPIEKLWDSNFGGRIAEAMALRDLDAIRRADIFIIDTLDTSTTGGRNCELGYALALEKRIILIGEPTSVFFSLARESYLTWDEFFEVEDEIL